MSVLSPWALYSLLGQSGSPFAGTGGGSTPFGALTGTSITAPQTPAPGPPSSSVTTGTPSQLATAVAPMPVSSGVPAVPAPSAAAPASTPTPAPNTGWTAQSGGTFSWTGQGAPQNDPYGRPLPAGWNTGSNAYLANLPTGQTYTYGPQGIGFGPAAGGGTGAITGGGQGGLGAPSGGVNQGTVGGGDVSAPQMGGAGAVPT